MEIPDETTDDLIRRLRRIEGQVRGIQAMLLERRDCADVVTQIAAANKALEQVGFKLVATSRSATSSRPTSTTTTSPAGSPWPAGAARPTSSTPTIPWTSTATAPATAT